MSNAALILKHHVNSEGVRRRFDHHLRIFSEFGRGSTRELRISPRVRIYSDVQQHFAVIGRRDRRGPSMRSDGVLGDDGKGNHVLCVLPNAEVLDFAVFVEKVGAGEEAAGREGVMGAVDA